MATITFDTHKFVRKLKSGGFSEQQAETVADAFKDASGEAEIATKRDLEMLKADLRVDLERIERKQIEQDGEFKLLKWMLALVVAAEVVPVLAKLLQ
jgi:hypothetical protein